MSRVFPCVCLNVTPFYRDDFYDVTITSCREHVIFLLIGQLLLLFTRTYRTER
jgi:hypothetical protein